VLDREIERSPALRRRRSPSRPPRRRVIPRQLCGRGWLPNAGAKHSTAPTDSPTSVCLCSVRSRSCPRAGTALALNVDVAHALNCIRDRQRRRTPTHHEAKPCGRFATHQSKGALAAAVPRTAFDDPLAILSCDEFGQSDTPQELVRNRALRLRRWHSSSSNVRGCFSKSHDGASLFRSTACPLRL
jgi:hypothetical protein